MYISVFLVPSPEFVKDVSKISHVIKDKYIDSDIDRFVLKWTSIKYSFSVAAIMDNIRIQVYLLQDDINKHLK
jgi:hypothetical protein